MHLFKVILRGLHSATSTDYNTSYVVAPDASSAYQRVKDFLDKENLGFIDGRELAKIELLAEEGQYPKCKTILFLPEVA